MSTKQRISASEGKGRHRPLQLWGVGTTESRPRAPQRCRPNASIDGGCQVLARQPLHKHQ
eukprot:1721629-Lingulodinium_polyedra.AAC.1